MGCRVLRSLLVGSCLWVSTLAWAVDINQLPPWVREALTPIEVSGLGLEAPLSELRPVHLGNSEVTTAPNSVSGLTLLLTLKTLVDEGGLTPETCPKWLQDQGADTATLIGVLDEMTLDHPMDPLYLPVCQVLWSPTRPASSWASTSVSSNGKRTPRSCWHRYPRSGRNRTRRCRCIMWRMNCWTTGRSRLGSASGPGSGGRPCKGRVSRPLSATTSHKPAGSCGRTQVRRRHTRKS